MTKKLMIFLAVLVLVLSPAIFAEATLTDNGNGTITDTDLGIMWLKTPGADANWADAQAWADSLVYAGYDNWRLPSALDFTTRLPDTVWNSTNNEFGHLYGTELNNPANSSEILPLVGYEPVWYWTGTAGPGSSVGAYAFFWSFDGLWLNTADQPGLTTSSLLHATAVREIGGVSVPEPSTMLLLGSSLVGLIGFRRKF